MYFILILYLFTVNMIRIERLYFIKVRRIVIFLFLMTALLSCRHKVSHIKAQPHNKRITEIKDVQRQVVETEVDVNIDDICNAKCHFDANEVLIKRKGYIVSYNKSTLIPNWVGWNLTCNHTDGEYPRDNNYYEDEGVPSPRATNEDYIGSGWSRGHMCPAGDNKWDREAMMESNLLTNICPQDRSLNSGLWNKIEQDCRKWAKKYGEVYIVCGPILFNKEHQTIGKNKIVVPEAFYKVVLRMKPKPKAIGFVVRNNNGAKKRDQYINSVDEVERITGIDFYAALPDSIENEVESYSNIEDW